MEDQVDYLEKKATADEKELFNNTKRKLQDYEDELKLTDQSKEAEKLNLLSENQAL